MTPRFRFCALVLPLAWACDSQPPGLPDVSAHPPSIAGTYHMQGSTTVVATGDSRPISGSLILSQDGTSYTATFHLSTAFGSPDGNIQAQVIGTGQGELLADSLVGTASTQILTASFPGVNPSFPFLRRVYGPRILSTSVGKVHEDGSIELEIETQAAEGQVYSATRTIMSGSPSLPGGVPGFPPVGEERRAMLEAAAAEKR